MGRLAGAVWARQKGATMEASASESVSMVLRMVFLFARKNQNNTHEGKVYTGEAESWIVGVVHAQSKRILQTKGQKMRF
jgi:hypothetical protein